MRQSSRRSRGRGGAQRPEGQLLSADGTAFMEPQRGEAATVAWADSGPPGRVIPGFGPLGLVSTWVSLREEGSRSWPRGPQPVCLRGGQQQPGTINVVEATCSPDE